MFLNLRVFGVVFGVFGGGMSLEAMLAEVGDRPNTERQLAVVPNSNNAFLVQNNELRNLGRDWHDLYAAFRHDLPNGGSAEFDVLLSSRSLHPVCQFIAENVFAHVLASQDRSELVRNADFFNSMKNFVNPGMRDEGGYIDKKMLIDLMLLKMDGLVPKSVEDSILAGMSRIIDARTGTLVKEEEFKQFKIECDKDLLKAKTDAEMEMLRTNVKRLQTLYELDEREKRSSVRHIELMRRLEIAERAHKLADQSDRDRLNIRRSQWEHEKDVIETAARERDRERQQIFSIIKESLKLGVEVVGGVVHLFGL